MKTANNYEYPLNLIKVLINDDKTDEELNQLSKNFDYNLTVLFNNSCGTFSDREKNILLSYYKYFLSLPEIAKKYKASVQIIKSIIYKTIKKLIYPKIFNYLVGEKAEDARIINFIEAKEYYAENYDIPSAKIDENYANALSIEDCKNPVKFIDENRIDDLGLPVIIMTKLNAASIYHIKDLLKWNKKKLLNIKDLDETRYQILIDTLIASKDKLSNKFKTWLRENA